MVIDEETMLERLLGLDIGDKYIGIAVSDPLGFTAQGYRTYKRGDRVADITFFQDVVNQFNVRVMVIGMPKNMDGTESSQMRKTENYARFLKKRLGVELIFQDERLSTQASEKALIEGKWRRENRKDVIDTLAAQLILQGYLDGNRSEN